METRHTSFSKQLERRFEEYCNEHALLETDSLLVAFSGGADSRVLLSLLLPLCQKRKIRLGAFHVNHAIRKEEADRDELFCQDVCAQYGIPFGKIRCDVPWYAEKNKIGLEEAARILRYEALTAHAQAEGYARIATAHNATDQLETVLFHLVRGSALSGSGGMLPLNDNRIKPLLFATKAEILSYAAENNLSFVTDTTNDDTVYTRNYIRHEILPKLARINPRAENAFLRFSEAVHQDDAFLYTLAKPYVSCRSVPTLAGLDDALLNRVLLINLRQNAHNEITSEHLRIVRQKFREAACGTFEGRLSLPGKLTLEITPTTLSFLDNSPEETKDSAQRPSRTDLPLDQTVAFSQHFRVQLTSKAPCTNEPSISNTVTVRIPKSQIEGELYLRCRQEGDRYTLRGMTRKVKKLLNEHQIPPSLRSTLPFLCDEKGILYVLYLPPSDRLLAQEEETDFYYLIIQIITEESQNGNNQQTL